MKPRSILGAFAALAAGGPLSFLLLALGRLDPPEGVSGYYLSRSIPDSASINVVTTILLDYRGFDTLGEATVIFTSVAAVSVLFAHASVPRSERGASVLVKRGIGFLIPFFWLFAVYVITNGHLSPGGGFQGGVVFAVLIILLSVVYGTQFGTARVPLWALHRTESAAALAFLAVGTVGMVQGLAFLTNAAAGFPTGTPGELFSAGAIPILNLIIGCKVASGLGSIFFSLLSDGEEGP